MALQENKSEDKTPEKAAPVLKGVQSESNDTGQVPAAGPKTGAASGSVQNPAQTNSTSSASSEDKLTGSSGDGYGMYIFLGLLLGLFGYLWSKGHLQSFRKYVMETMIPKMHLSRRRRTFVKVGACHGNFCLCPVANRGAL